jgi:hypothetical protein
MRLPIRRTFGLAFATALLASVLMVTSTVPAAPSVSTGDRGVTRCRVFISNDTGEFVDIYGRPDLGPGDNWDPKPPGGFAAVGGGYASEDDDGHGCSNTVKWKQVIGTDCYEVQRDRLEPVCVWTAHVALKKNDNNQFVPDVDCSVTLPKVISCSKLKVDHDKGSNRLRVTFDFCYIGIRRIVSCEKR